jgi:protein phosphatase
MADPGPAKLLVLPPDALVLLVGPAGSGKTTFAARHFRSTEVLSSDAFRAMVSGDAGDQDASADAFALLHRAATARLRRGLLTVVDATNLLGSARQPLLRMAQRLGRPAVAIAFGTPLAECLARDVRRQDRHVPAAVIRHQHRLMERAVERLPDEGYVLLVDVADVDGPASSATVEAAAGAEATTDVSRMDVAATTSAGAPAADAPGG